MALMAATRQWRLMMTTTAQNRTFAYATPPKFRSTSVPHGHGNAPSSLKSKYLSVDGAPIMIIGGFLAMVLALGAHSIWQQLAYAPSVHVKKEKRESMPEVYDSDVVFGSADKFSKNSFLRKVGNIQEKKPPLVKPVGPVVLQSRDTETLKSVGVR